MIDIINSLRNIDLHMHTTVSDGTDTPDEIVRNVQNRNIKLFSITDHDSIHGCNIVEHKENKYGLYFITGVEFSCQDELGKYHILGYGYKLDSEDIQSIVNKSHDLRMQKITARIDKLRKVYNIELSKSEIDGLMQMENPGKPHIANILVKRGYAKTITEAINKYLTSISIKNKHIRPEEAIQAILNGNGIPVLAHPIFGSGDNMIRGTQMIDRVNHLKPMGLMGLETFYSKFDESMHNEIYELADRYNLYMTAGSDYHGKTKNVSIGEIGYKADDKLPKKMIEFIENVNIVKL